MLSKRSLAVILLLALLCVSSTEGGLFGKKKSAGESQDAAAAASDEDQAGAKDSAASVEAPKHTPLSLSDLDVSINSGGAIIKVKTATLAKAVNVAFRRFLLTESQKTGESAADLPTIDLKENTIVVQAPIASAEARAQLGKDVEEFKYKVNKLSVRKGKLQRGFVQSMETDPAVPTKKGLVGRLASRFFGDERSGFEKTTIAAWDTFFPAAASRVEDSVELLLGDLVGDVSLSSADLDMTISEEWTELNVSVAGDGKKKKEL
jgi:hypothetical protein